MRGDIPLFESENERMQKRSDMKYGTGLINDGNEFDDLYDEVMEDMSFKSTSSAGKQSDEEDEGDQGESDDKNTHENGHGHTHSTNIHKKTSSFGRGFTLIEVLIVIGILAILATLVLVAVNPGRQFKLARDTKRAADISTILSAVSQNIADHAGVFTCGEDAADIPDTETTITSNQSGFDLAECVVPTYISALPFDPGQTTAKWNTETDYDTGYTIQKDSFNRVTISAVGEGEDNSIISVTR